MSPEFELKKITRTGLDSAVARAEHYRLLNQPKLAQSICFDVLEVDPENQRALIALVLAMTDEFEASSASASAARRFAARITDEYQRHYYEGIISERAGRAALGRRAGTGMAYQSLAEAMEHFEKAESLRPEGNDDAILRWNACARTIQESNLRPPQPDDEPQLLE